MTKAKETKKNTKGLTKGEKRLIELVKIASELVLREDKLLLKELAKH